MHCVIAALAWLPHPHRLGCTPSLHSARCPPPLAGLDIAGVGDALTSIGDAFSAFEFDAASRSLSSALDIGESFRSVSNLEPGIESVVLESIGRDLLVFLAASVVVMPAAKALRTTPILGFLLLGALLGEHGFGVFSNSEADVELGDFGILFLLFSEGLEVSTERLSSLALFLPLGLAQIALTTGVLTTAILAGGPELLERFLPLDAGLINIHVPSEAFVLAVAGTLSTSAFVFPVIKEKGWTDEESGKAATSILLLQDLAVAPLLVILPFIIGQGVTDANALIELTAKATLGFGGVLVAGSFLLRRLFALVAETRSTETFVALCLLVSVGMGTIAKACGLTDTAGAFAAGVLLANSNYRAQIQADILPFKGILLGIFFMTAGSNFDSSLVLSEWPTVLTGVVTLILLKALTLLAATRVPEAVEPNRLPAADGVRLSLLLSGGGEFAFVVLALAEKLGALPVDLGGLLTAIVLVTMGVTPLLGDLAERLSHPLAEREENAEAEAAQRVGAAGQPTQVATDAVVVCGFGDVGRAVSRSLDENCPRGLCAVSYDDDDDDNSRSPLAAGILADLPPIVAFSKDASLAGEIVLQGRETVVLFGDGANPEVLHASGIEAPRAIFVTYRELERCRDATTRLRQAFADSPIFTRCETREGEKELRRCGATEVVVETDELPRLATALMLGAAAPQPLATFRAIGDAEGAREGGAAGGAEGMQAARAPLSLLDPPAERTLRSDAELEAEVVTREEALREQ